MRRAGAFGSHPQLDRRVSRAWNEFMYMYMRRGLGVNALEGVAETERERENGGPLRAAFPITRSN